MRPWFRWEFPRGGFVEIYGDLASLDVEDIGNLCEALAVTKRVVARIQQKSGPHWRPLEFWQ